MSRRIRRLLVANRGEIARRVFATARDMGIECIAVFADADAGAPFVVEADDAIRLPGSYLDAEAIVAAALAVGADAVHPGYGFLSENPRFAELVAAAGLVWVGPTPDVIRTMGDKVTAKRIAAQAGVPTLPGAEDAGDADLAAIGLPVLVKAAAGGGGKGMRVVASTAELGEAVAAARREAAAAFGDDRVFVERYIQRARHIEIQIVGDAFGTVIHLGERECSIQRRHQKIIEEAPSPYISGELRDRMGAASVALATMLGYSSVGTVEYVVDADTDEFFFLEVNTRLQVEHPVTEAVTGVDLVREQLRIAEGLPLELEQAGVRFDGHAIEARLYAEDPDNDFLPATGVVRAFEPAASPQVRWDCGVGVGSEIGVLFDPMIAKVIAHAPTRGEAAARLAHALDRLHLAGVVTNRRLLGAILRDEAFRAGELSTDFLERRRPAAAAALGDDELERAAVVAALWLQGAHRAAGGAWRHIPSGWRNSKMPAQRVRLAIGERSIEVSYRRRSDGAFDVDGSGIARVHAWSPEAVDVELGGRRRRSRVTFAADVVHVQLPNGGVDLLVEPRFPVTEAAVVAGSLVAPMPATVVDVRVTEGECVEHGQLLMLLEAMKMEHRIAAPAAGTVVAVHAVRGAQVARGDVLLVLDTA